MKKYKKYKNKKYGIDRHVYIFLIRKKNFSKNIRLSVHPSVVITISSERKELLTSNFANRLLLGTSYLDQSGIPGYCAHEKSDSHQI